MTVLDSIAKQANRLATDVQMSLKRARVEGERRLLQRQHRAALEELGERAYELVRAGTIAEEPLASEVGAVEAKLMEIEAKVAEIESLRSDEDEGEGGATAGAGTEDASRTAFPMVGDEGGSNGGPGPGWDAAEKFFGGGSKGA
jgi:chromosome segregation ATPase